MAVAVSRTVNPGDQDVLAGTVCGVLPANAPAYDIELMLATDADGSVDNSFTFLVDGASVMERAAIPLSRAFATAAQVGIRSDSPTMFTSAPSGARLTLNVHGTAANSVRLFIEARERTTAEPPAVGHIFRLPVVAATAIQGLDLLAGTPVSSIPNTAQLWNVAIIGGMLVSQGDAAKPVLPIITFIVDSDTVAEDFQIPTRDQAHDFPVEERDTLISTLVTGGSRLTLNVRRPAQDTITGNLYLKVYANPVG